MAAPIHAADKGDTTMLGPTLEAAKRNLSVATPEDPCDLVADKGYHLRDVLKEQYGGPWKTRIAESRPSKGYLRWHGDVEARAAVYANRNRLRSGVVVVAYDTHIAALIIAVAATLSSGCYIFCHRAAISIARSFSCAPHWPYFAFWADLDDPKRLALMHCSIVWCAKPVGDEIGAVSSRATTGASAWTPPIEVFFHRN